MNRIRDLAIALLCVTLSVCAIVITRKVGPAIDNVNATAKAGKEAATIARDYLAYQQQRLLDPRNQKSLEAGWQAPAIANGTLRLINTQTLPRVHRGLEGLERVELSLVEAVGDLRTLIRNTDRSINQTLVPEIAEVARAARVTIEELKTEIIRLAEEGLVSIRQVNALLASPEWLEILRSIAASTKTGEQIAADIKAISGNAAQASANLPSIAESLEKIAKASSKYSKAILIARIISALAGAFIR